MIEYDEGPQNNGADADFLQRLDYHEMRTATQIERLEERVRQLEGELRSINDSGDADLRRLRTLGARVFSRKMPEPHIQGNATTSEKRFPITMRHTSIGLIVLTGIVTAIRGSDDSANGAELLGRWFGIFLFCASWPAIVAYVVAGRKEQWSRNDRWYFWGSTITSLWVLILTFQTAR